MTRAPDAAVDTRGLTKRFRRAVGLRDLLARRRPVERTAVDDLSLAIGHGELFGLLGQNGAGKTTLIRMLTTTLLPTAGSARVAGHDVVGEPGAVRRAIGLVNGDERSFYLRLTGRQNLDFFASLLHVPADIARGRTAALAERLDLADDLDRPYNGYSSGQRHKLAIVRGLLTDPAIVFMDEPTRALDPIAAHTLRRFIADDLVGRQGKTVVLATHSTVEAEELCHRLALIRTGRLAGIGTIGELRDRVGRRDRADVRIRSLPDGLIDRLRALPVVRSVSIAPEDDAVRLDLHLVDPDALGEALACVVAAGATVIAAATRQATLEEIYLATHAQPEGAAA